MSDLTDDMKKVMSMMRKKKAVRPDHELGRDAQGEFPWRNSRQISGVQANLQGAINDCDDGAYVTIDIKLAYDLIEICRQAKHTEVGHGV